MQLKKTLSLVAIGATTLLLTACGSAPSDSDINAALQTEIKEMPSSMTQALAPKLLSSKKIECKDEDSSLRYRCTVEVEIQTKYSTQKNVRTLTFIKTDDGWKRVENTYSN